MNKSVIAAALLVAAAVFFGGCSGKGGTTTPGPSAEEKYAQFSTDIEDFVGSIVDFMGQGYDDFQEFDPAAIPPPPILRKYAAVVDTILELDTTYANGWYIITASEQSETETISIADSIKFVNSNNQALHFPTVETTNGVYLKEHAEVTMLVPEYAMSMTFIVHGDFSFIGFLSTVVEVNGAADFEMDLAGETDYGPSTANMTFHVTINDVQVVPSVGEGDGCAAGGSFTIDFAGTVDGYDEVGNHIDASVEADITVHFNSSGAGYYFVDIDGQRFTEPISGCGTN